MIPRVVFALIFVVQVCHGAHFVNILRARFNEWTEGCANKAKYLQGWCHVDDVIEDPNFRCWVTAFTRCDGTVHIREGSVCRHSVTAAVRKCESGEWRLKSVYPSKPRKRVKRFLFWGDDDSEEVEVPDYGPSISCPGDIIQAASFGQTTSRVTWSAPTASDDRSTPSVNRIEGPGPGSTFNEGSTLIRYRARDSMGQNAECHFTVTITVEYCSSLTYFEHGWRSCSGAKENVYGSECSHNCEAGYALQGNSVVRCLSGSTWSAQFPSCQPVSCGMPAGIAGGHVVCLQGYVFPQTCEIQCEAGFEHSGVTSVTCTSSGVWTDGDPCVDVQPPQFTNGCPSNQNLFSGPLHAPVTVTWTDPVTTDNSGQLVTLTAAPQKDSQFGPGSHSVVITATDVTGNKASCEFTITVQVRECQAVQAPDNGNVQCTAGLVEGSVCTVSCNHGYRLQGQAALTCLDTELWDSTSPTCEAVICPTPSHVDHGQFSCPSGHQCPAVCTLTCAAGFQVTGPQDIQCLQEGTWTAAGSCDDIESPVFVSGCPDNMAVYAARLGQPTVVSWTTPAVSDNSGDIIQLTSDVTAGSAFQPGTTVVTYEAVDGSGNRNTCHFNVTVTVLSCDAPALQPTPAAEPNPVREWCPDRYVYGATCTLNCTQGYRLQGQRTVTCERDDRTHPPTMTWVWSGPESVKPQCKEDKCPALPPPKNGALSCYLGDMGWDCHLACEAAYDVPFKSYAWFVCPNERRFWSPSHVPDCIARHLPGRVRMMADVSYFTGSCSVSIEELRQHFIQRISESVYGSACARIPSCVAENIEVTCSNSSRLIRTRRDVDKMTSHRIRVTFHVTMPYVEDTVTPEEAYKNYHDKADMIMEHLRSRAISGELNAGGLDLVVDDSCSGLVGMRADCPDGTVYRVKRNQARFSCVSDGT